MIVDNELPREAAVPLSHLLPPALQTPWQRSQLATCSPTMRFLWSSRTRRHLMAIWIPWLVSNECVRWVSPRKCGWSKKWFECMSWGNIFDFSRSSCAEGTFYLNGPFTARTSGCLCLREVEVGPGGIVSESSHHNMLNMLATGVFWFSLKRLVMSKSVFMFFIRSHMFIVCLCPTGIPDCSEEDLSVARALNLRWTTVLKSDEDGTQTLVNSDEVRTHHW